jgi:hypothetical protein
VVILSEQPVPTIGALTKARQQKRLELGFELSEPVVLRL